MPRRGRESRPRSRHHAEIELEGILRQRIEDLETGEALIPPKYKGTSLLRL
jgi:hypothetical protein